MPEALALLLRLLAIGIGATATMDFIGVAASLAFGGALPDYALVGDGSAIWRPPLALATSHVSRE